MKKVQTGQRMLPARAEDASALLSAIVESSDDAIISKDLNGIITSWNLSAERLFGYTPEEAVGQPITMLIPPDRLEEEPRILARIRRGERVEHFETVRVRKDGSRLDISLTISPVRNARGEIIGASKIARDITERKRAEEQLRRNHDTFYHLVANNPFGIYVVDGDFRLRQVSAGSQKVFSNVRPLLGRDFAEVLRILWPEPFASEAIARFRHTLATGEPYRSASTTERRHDIAETESYDWKIERIVLPSGQFGVVCYFYDMTERQRAEAALRESEQRFRSLISVITDIPWVRDATGAFISPQPEWEAYTGQSWEEHRGFGWTNAIHPEDRERIKEIWANACATGTRYEAEGRIWHAPAKEWRQFVARGTPLLNADGTVREWVGSITDVETEKLAQEASRRIEQLAAAGRMAAVVAHEINNPLESVVNCWYLLGKEKLSARGRQFLALAGEELNRIMHIARQSLSFYRAPSHSEAVDVLAVIEDALQSVRMRSAHVRVAVASRDPGPASGHEAELRQVVLNVLINAVEAGSGNIKVRVSPSMDWKNPQRRGVRITISDDGKGIAKNKLPHIFEPFYTTKEAKGMGLGLWVSNGIVVKHGGSMKVRSNAEPGRSGTVTSIFFQAAAPAVQPTSAALEPKVAV